VALIGAAVYFAIENNKKIPATNIELNNQATQSPDAGDYENKPPLVESGVKKTYSNAKYHFSIQIPEEHTVDLREGQDIHDSDVIDAEFSIYRPGDQDRYMVIFIYQEPMSTVLSELQITSSPEKISLAGEEWSKYTTSITIQGEVLYSYHLLLRKGDLTYYIGYGDYEGYPKSEPVVKSFTFVQ
jgi:hypothetical protein